MTTAPKYLISANYTAKRMEGVRAAGAKSRLDAVPAMLEAMGGRLESLRFAFGDTDVFAVAEAPHDEAAAAVGIAINSSGAVSTRTTKLLTVKTRQKSRASSREEAANPPQQVNYFLGALGELVQRLRDPSRSVRARTS